MRKTGCTLCTDSWQEGVTQVPWQMCPTCCGNVEKQGITQAGEAEKCLHRRSEIKLSERCEIELRECLEHSGILLDTGMRDASNILYIFW